eukprot:4916298-Ditylum_brightwellii.AAC.1
MAISESAYSNWELAIYVIEKVIAPVYSKKEVKDHMKNSYPITNFLIMAGGITPKAQPLDKLINKIWK